MIRRKPVLCRLGLHMYRPAAAGRDPSQTGSWFVLRTHPRCSQCGRWKR